MGRLNHAASRVHTHATNILANTSHTHPPPWLTTIQTTPPSTKLTRPILRRPNKPSSAKKARPSRLFQPVNITYQEDRLRWEYFNDHPWELARPRVVLEDDGRDSERWDWSVELDVSLNRPKAGSRDESGRTDREWEGIMERLSGRPVNGEAVVKRQHWLLHHTSLSEAAAYDTARKELYRLRHSQETLVRVAREEALSTGAFFGPGPLEIGMQLEDKAYEDWKEWARTETEALRQLRSSSYTGSGEGDEAAAETEIVDPSGQQEELQAVSNSVPATNKGQTARGGAVVRPA